MSTKTYTVRVPAGTPDISSEDVAAWLDAQLGSNAPLAADPGAGERSLRLSLDKEKVEQAARSAVKPEATFLRRLIATNVAMPQEEKQHEQKDEARPKTPVLKGALSSSRYTVPGPATPVTLMASPASKIRRVSSGRLKAKIATGTSKAAAFTEEEREELSVSTCEVLNRRAPRALVENIDLVGLATTVIAIESRKIEQVQAVAEYLRQQQAQNAAQEPGSQQEPEAQSGQFGGVVS